MVTVDMPIAFVQRYTRGRWSPPLRVAFDRVREGHYRMQVQPVGERHRERRSHNRKEA
jgi:hypothetical protein